MTDAGGEPAGLARLPRFETLEIRATPMVIVASLAVPLGVRAEENVAGFALARLPRFACTLTGGTNRHRIDVPPAQACSNSGSGVSQRLRNIYFPEMMTAKLVLFGGSGFVGSNLLKHLKNDVVAPSEFEADLTKIDSLRAVIGRGDVVINAAGYANATDRTAKGRELFRSVNVEGLRNLAEACAQEGAAQLVHISSVAAMGRWQGEGISEDMMRPVDSPYAASKLEGEKLLGQFADTIPITILRPTSVFGEGRGLAATLCSLVRKGVVPLPRGGRARIPFTYVGNVAYAVSLAVGNERCFGRTFIIGDETSYPLRDVVSALAKGMGMRARIVAVPYPIWYAAAVGFEIMARLRGTAPLLDRGRLDTMTLSVSYSIEPFRQATGYAPPFGIEEAAERIAAWYLGRG